MKGGSLLSLVLVSLAAAATAAFYLHDYLVATWSTLYPGQRFLPGGGVAFEEWISQFLPTSQIHHHESLIGQNICEISTVGSFYISAVLFFLDYIQLGRVQSRRFWYVLLVLLTGLLATYAWMFLPLPAWVGAPLLWNRVPPGRMIFASGLLLLFTVFILAQKLGLKLTRIRVTLFSAFVFIGWYYYKHTRSNLGFFESWLDLVVLVPIVATSVVRRSITIKQKHTLVLTSTLLIGILSFGSFNPIQSAWQIFKPSAYCYY